MYVSRVTSFLYVVVQMVLASRIRPHKDLHIDRLNFVFHCIRMSL